MRWLSALVLCGFLALAGAMATQAPPSFAMQESTPPSQTASDFCPGAGNPPPLTKVANQDTSIFIPAEEEPGAVQVRDIQNPVDTNPDTGKLLLTFVTLQPNTCILGSYFYPAVNIRVTSGPISILIEHWPGAGDAPVAKKYAGGAGIPQTLAVDTPATLATDDWVQITNESFVGFANSGDAPATFVVAGLKPDGEVGGGGCDGGCRNRP